MKNVFRLLIIALIVYFVCYYLFTLWPLLLILFVMGSGWGLLFIALIVIVYFVIVGLLKGLEGETPPEQKQDKIIYQQRRANIPPPEPPTTDLYDFQMLNASYYMLQWLADAPYAHICYNIEQLLRQKIADSLISPPLRCRNGKPWKSGKKKTAKPSPSAAPAWRLNLCCMCPAMAKPTSSPAYTHGRAAA